MVERADAEWFRGLLQKAGGALAEGRVEMDVEAIMAGKPPIFANTRELTAEDIIMPAGPSTAAVVREMRESHHQLARLVAQGLKGVEVCAITGFSQSRLSILKSDPAFKELIVHYREVKESAFADVQGQIAAFGADTLGELRDRLESQPETFGNRDLLEILNSMMDRSGHGRTQTVENKVLTISGDTLLKLKQQAKEIQQGHVTSKRGAEAEQGEVGEQSPTGGLQADKPEDQRVEVGEVIPLRPGIQTGEAEGKSREGDDL